MKFLGNGGREAIRTLFRPTMIPAAIAVTVIGAFGVFADHQNREAVLQEMRADVADRANLIRAKLEGNIKGNLQLVRGLVSVLRVEPEISAERFQALAASVLGERSQIVMLAVAPDLVVTMVHPLAGNEAVLGLNHRDNPAQREAVFRAISTGELVLAGPVQLVQGGSGLIARVPIFAGRADGSRQLWGMFSAIIDSEKLFRDSGLYEPGLPLDVAITGTDGMGGEGKRFYGDADILRMSPVTADVALPFGSWQIAAVPKEGWEATDSSSWLLRLVLLAAGILVVGPILVAGRLMEERQANIAELRRREEQLHRLSQRLGLALDASRIGVWEMDLASGQIFWDDRMNELYGLPPGGAPRSAQEWTDLIHTDDVARARQEFMSALKTRSYLSEFRVVAKDGSVRSIRAIGAVHDDGNRPAIVGANWDVTADVALNEALLRAKRLTEARNVELESAKARIEYNALHDSLTGLPNRRYLDDMLQLQAGRAAKSGTGLGLLHMDLDRFKQINDTLGHAAGDAMLVHVADILRAAVRASDFVARIGGDEFVVLCTEASDPAALASLAERIIDEIRVPLSFRGHECRSGASVGIALETGEDFDCARLLVNADIALYQAKARGRGRHEFFTAALQEEIVHTKKRADDILAGLERSEFIAHYQPQFDARTLAVIGVEALARWEHPSEGMLAPDAFLKVAEELNVLATIDRMILEQSLRDHRNWSAAGLAIPKVSVNVSLRRLRDERLIEGLRSLDIPRGLISFELVESIYLDESDELAGSTIADINALGIDIEIDDFGTGYASIVSLLKLRPRRLKIDRQLVMPIAHSPAQRQLVSSIIDIGKTLGIEVVAEGVETMEHARILRDLGCDALQGYALARPMSAEQLTSFLQTQTFRAAG